MDAKSPLSVRIINNRTQQLLPVPVLFKHIRGFVFCKLRALTQETFQSMRYTAAAASLLSTVFAFQVKSAVVVAENIM